jgi:hypothetical protein
VLRRLLLRYRSDGGKVRIRVLQAIDRGRGPLAASPERPGPDGMSEMTVSYCAAHREHRVMAGMLADVPGVESISELPPEPAGTGR